MEETKYEENAAKIIALKTIGGAMHYCLQKNGKRPTRELQHLENCVGFTFSNYSTIDYVIGTSITIRSDNFLFIYYHHELNEKREVYPETRDGILSGKPD